jgi:hypothetical protein
MNIQTRFYLLLLNDPKGARPQGPYTKSQARLAQIANVGSRVITAAQLATMRAAVETCDYCDTRTDAPNFGYHVCTGRKMKKTKRKGGDAIE